MSLVMTSPCPSPGKVNISTTPLQPYPSQAKDLFCKGIKLTVSWRVTPWPCKLSKLIWGNYAATSLNSAQLTSLQKVIYALRSMNLSIEKSTWLSLIMLGITKKENLFFPSFFNIRNVRLFWRNKVDFFPNKGSLGLLRWLSGKSQTANVGDARDNGFSPWVGKIPWRRKWQPTPISCLGKSHGQRSLAGYSPWGSKESDMIKWLSMHTNVILQVL